ncbi:MAG: hypothetical protein ACI9YO_002967 [Gammaproteobacteria bacterium]|jgi:hypothetical protein
MHALSTMQMLQRFSEHTRKYEKQDWGYQMMGLSGVNRFLFALSFEININN